MKYYLETVFMVFFALTLGLMSFKIEYTNYTLIPVILIWFYTNQYKNLYKNFKQNKIYYLISILFILALISFFIYQDRGNLKQLEKRIAFVLFPIIISTTNFLSKRRIISLIKFFCYALTAICIYALAKILLIFIEFHYLPNLGEGPWVNDYILMHRPYFGMYSSFTIVCFIYFIEEKLCSKLLGIFIVISNVLVIFFITAKLALIFLGLYLTYKALIAIMKKKSFKKGILFISLFLVPLLFMFKYNTEFFLDRINSPIKNQDRLKTWSSAIDVIANDKFNMVFGYFSDYKFQQELNAVYNKKNYPIYNTHNQYLGYFGSYGIFGFIVFALILVQLLLFSIKNKENLFTLFILLLFLQCLTENIFSRQWGIFFVSVFTSLFIRLIYENNKYLNEKSCDTNPTF